MGQRENEEFNNLRGRPHGRSPEDVKDTPPGALQKSKRKGKKPKEGTKPKRKKMKTQKAKMKRNQGPKSKNFKKHT